MNAVIHGPRKALGEALIYVMDWARANNQSFIFGPISRTIVDEGLHLDGDIEDLLNALRRDGSQALEFTTEL